MAPTNTNMPDKRSEKKSRIKLPVKGKTLLGIDLHRFIVKDLPGDNEEQDQTPKIPQNLAIEKEDNTLRYVALSLAGLLFIILFLFIGAILVVKNVIKTENGVLRNRALQIYSVLPGAEIDANFVLDSVAIAMRKQENFELNGALTVNSVLLRNYLQDERFRLDITGPITYRDNKVYSNLSFSWGQGINAETTSLDESSYFRINYLSEWILRHYFGTDDISSADLYGKWIEYDGLKPLSLDFSNMERAVLIGNDEDHYEVSVPYSVGEDFRGTQLVLNIDKDTSLVQGGAINFALTRDAYLAFPVDFGTSLEEVTVAKYNYSFTLEPVEEGAEIVPLSDAMRFITFLRAADRIYQEAGALKDYALLINASEGVSDTVLTIFEENTVYPFSKEEITSAENFNLSYFGEFESGIVNYFKESDTSGVVYLAVPNPKINEQKLYLVYRINGNSYIAETYSKEELIEFLGGYGITPVLREDYFEVESIFGKLILERYRGEI